MKSRIDKAKNEVNKDEIILTKDVDLNKLTFKQNKQSGPTQKWLTLWLEKTNKIININEYFTINFQE